jgi:excinuclease UvrABC helicase subunit UvrB
MRNRKNKNLFNGFDALFNDMNSLFGGFNSLNFNGNTNTEEGVDENGSWVKQTFMSEDGSIIMTSVYRTDGETTPTKSNKIDILKRRLNNCVEIDDFETAIKIREEIKKLEQNSEKIEELEKQLAEKIEEQDFETAIKLRDELKKL